MGKKLKLVGIADTPHAQAQGLQFVRTLDADAGMLFKFQQPRILSFWMQNTYLPLDIAFVDHTNTIVKIERMIPLSLRTVTSGKPCHMAIETLSGTLEKAGIAIGSAVVVDHDGKTVTLG